MQLRKLLVLHYIGKGGNIDMNSLANVILSTTADAALEALLASAGLASAAGTYQPEEPKDLMKVAESRKARK